jgi:hypothetical protein
MDNVNVHINELQAFNWKICLPIRKDRTVIQNINRILCLSSIVMLKPLVRNGISHIELIKHV